MLGQPLKLHCDIYPGNIPGRWYRNGQLIQPSDRINIIHRNKYDHHMEQLDDDTLIWLSPFLFFRVHRLEIETSSLHDAGDYTFVPEGYSQSLSAKVHIIGTKTTLDKIPFCKLTGVQWAKAFILGCRSSKSTFGKLEPTRQHSYSCGRKQTSLRGSHQWRASTQSGVDEGRKGELSFHLAL